MPGSKAVGADFANKYWALGKQVTPVKSQPTSAEDKKKADNTLLIILGLAVIACGILFGIYGNWQT